MKRHSLLAITILTLTFLFHTAKDVSAVELITNGGFETGNFSGWTAVNSANGFINWNVSGANHGGGYNPPNFVTPIQGNFSAWQGIAVFQPGGGTYTLSQDITLPAAQTASFFWHDRFQSNLRDFCGGSGEPACGTQTYRVQILNTSNVVLQTLYTAAANPGQAGETGWLSHYVLLTPFAGQTIRIRFSTVATGNADGPGQIDIDSVSVQSPAAPNAAEVSVGGQIKSANGTGIRNVAVSLTTTNGQTQIVKTNAFGYYNFEGIEVGQSVTLTVNSKRYTFANPTRIVSVSENVGDIDFTSIE